MILFWREFRSTRFLFCFLFRCRKEIMERFISVFKELVHLVLIKATTFSSSSLDENCYMFNNLSVLLYHLFIIPYKYHTKYLFLVCMTEQIKCD